ncbi:uncharacterized protein EMH_0020570 [Eimeria mitis]|uniref:Uncharacterized protein n=1 Tax=Eimeria mitis TaxID=44415 RepID=U6JX15_9EIME|nr:uncharacterized protein EMH_0020570 [Eimeria mitis]CDJ29311.1 hypothetical protein, conserved [Eimeria mitis]
MAAPGPSGDPAVPEAITLSGLTEPNQLADAAACKVDVPAASAGQGTASASSSKPSSPAHLLPSALAETVARSNNTAGAFPSPQTGRGAITRSSLTRQNVGRQASLSSRVCGARTKSTRSGAAIGPIEQQRDTAETHAGAREAHRTCRNYGGSSLQPAVCSEVSPSCRGRGAKGSGRSVLEAGAVATPVPATDEGGCGRGLRRVAADAGAAGPACAATPQAAADDSSSAASATPAVSLDYRGPRRSLRQALLANSGKTQVPGTAGCGSTAGEALLGGNTAAPATGPGPGNPAAAMTVSGGAFAGPGAAAGGRRRMRQPHRQLLQSYVVGQQHQQTGPQADERTTCLADWLDIRGSTPRCCCGASCVSCNTNWSGKANNASTVEGTFGGSNRGGGGSSSRSILDVHASAAAKRDRQQRQQMQQQCSGGSGFEAQQSDARSGDGILVCPSWFESPLELEVPTGLSCIRPSSPSRSAIFASQQAAWEEEDIVEAAEAAATTVGTPWPKGSTSCSFGGYGSATRNGGQVPLCCYCGLPLRPPAVSNLRGGGAESGCPLAAAAAAAAALGLDGWTQWCRCCTRVYGDLRLQHQRNATGLPFKSFSVPKAPLRYLLLPADGAKDTPGGAGAVAAALAAAAVADPRRSKLNDDNGATASAEADGDSVGVSTTCTPNSSSKSSSMGNTAPLRRTRSGHHFARAPTARSSSRGSNNPSDIMRFMGASCCWPSSVSSVSYVQPLARIQQRLTQLQQRYADQAPQLQQQQQRGSAEVPALPALQPVPVDGVKLPSLSSAAPANSSLAAAPASAASSLRVETETVASAGAKAQGASPTSEAQRLVDVGEAKAASVSLADTGLSTAPANTTAVAAQEAAKPGQRLAPADAPATANFRSPCSTGTSQASHASRLPAAKTETSTAKSRTVVIPRVYLESSSDCYVATAFDSVQQLLLQKRFCCTVLGEQRAHALACQWLRWVSKGAASAAQKSQMPHVQVNTVSGVQAAPAAAAAAYPSSALLADGLATVPTVAASPGRRAAAGGLWGMRRGPHRADTGGLPQHHENLRSERHLKRRRRCGETLEGSDRDDGSFPSQRFAAAATQCQRMEEV